MTDRNNSFSISTPGCWRTPNYLPEGILDKLKDLLKLRSQNDLEFNVEKLGNEENKY